MHSPADINSFITAVKSHYHQHGRHDLPWRIPQPDGTFDPYKILVSEVMLQQTQVARVIPKYQAFLQELPNTYVLARASFGEVLTLWSGLGYNRRAKFLRAAAEMIENTYAGRFPHDIAALMTLPGVGANTAGAVTTYAFNRPVVFIETNIRSVFLHHFFADKSGVSDAELLPYIKATLDRHNPREWYWALMDYGTYLKAIHPNPGQRSKHHAKQSRFKGSKREVRGIVLKALLSGKKSAVQLSRIISDERLGNVLGELCHEGLIVCQGSAYELAK